MRVLKSLFTLWILFVLVGCGVSTGPLDPDNDDAAGADASSESQQLVTEDGAIVDRDAQAPADQTQPPPDGATGQCNGCFLGTQCVPSTPVACGSNSACVRCPAPRVPECQEATCLEGACGVRNVPDGTGCTGGVCLGGACNLCGSNDTACCAAGNRCNPGLTCVAAAGSSFEYCTRCGGAGQACCATGVGTVTSGGSMPIARSPGGTCDPGLSCNAEGACTCGGLGEACCTGFTCRQGRCRHDGTCGT